MQILNVSDISDVDPGGRRFIGLMAIVPELADNGVLIQVVIET